MRSERAKFLTAVVLIPLSVILSLEIALRFSPAFNDFLYRNSSPRDHDHFRVQYRLDAAAADLSPLKIGFLGSSITRDGIDVRLFKERFPQASFYNFGGSIKVPVYELAYLSDYKKAGFSILVYPISAADIFKFREAGNAAGYYRWDGLMTAAGRLPNKEIFEKRGELLNNFAAASSYAFRFKEVVARAVLNSVSTSLGRPPSGNFDFYWEQQDLDDEDVMELKFKYGQRAKGFYKRKLKEEGRDIEDVAKLAEASGLKLIIYDMDSACPRLNERSGKEIRSATAKFSSLLSELPAKYKNVSYFKAEPFACEDYAEAFHLNERGRREALERLSIILKPVIETKGGA